MIKIEHEFHELTECVWMPPRYIRVIRAIRGQIKIMYVFCGARIIRVSGKIDVAKGTFDR